MLGWLSALIVVSAVALVVLFWARLPSRFLRSEGSREAATMGTFLMGNPYVAGKVSASASLPYYVMTGLLFALGFLGLAAGDSLAISLSRRYLLNAAILSWVVTGLRLVLEKAAAPAAWTYLVGIVWLPPAVGAYFAWNLKREGRGIKDLVLYLLAYAFAVRGAVAVLYVLASTFHLGTHYDVSQVTRVPLWGGQTYETERGGFVPLMVFFQFTFWPVMTVLSGLVGAFAASLFKGGVRVSGGTPARIPG
jgi:hypothetical protein